MNSNWEYKELSEIIDFNPRESLKKGEIAKKVGMDKLAPFNRDITEYEFEEYSGGAKFRNGDTLMARITPCLENGKTSYVDFLAEGEVGFGSTEFIVMRPKKGVADPYFVYYLATSSMVREPAIKSMVGSSGRQRVQIDVIKQLQLFLPPYEEQKKIASILKDLDDKIALNNDIADNEKQQLMAIFEEWFLANADESWPVRKLGDFFELERGLSYKGKYLVDEGEGVPMLNLGNILPNSVFRQEKLKYYSGEYKERHTVVPGDIIVANTDLTQDRLVLGSAIRVPDLEQDTVICSHHISIVKNSRISNNFILGLLNMPAYRKRVAGFATGTTVLALPNDTILGCEFSYPPKELITKYDELADTVNEHTEIIRIENKRLLELKELLVGKLLMGDIDVTNIEV